jgi:tripartite-type tricarboxylate transporter receptor subunit TctC
MLTRRRFVVASGCAIGFTPALRGTGWAQSIDRPARMLIGFQAGGSLDTIARMLADQMKDYAPSLIVENKAGAAGRIALETLKTSAPDGATMILTPASTLVLYPHIYKKLAYDSIADFAPVTSVGAVGYDIAVGPKVPASVKTLAEFVAWCKANPKDAAFGSPGAGTGHHFVGVMFARAAGLDMVHVPYRGAAPAIQDVLAGQIASNISVGAHIPLHKDGKLRILATAGARRAPALPDVPTFTESGFGVDASDWFGVVVPAATPPAVVAKLNAAVRTAIASQPVQGVLQRLGNTPRGESPEDFAALIKRDHAAWGAIVKAAGFTAEE